VTLKYYLYIYAVPYGKIHQNDHKEDEGREAIFLSRRSNYFVTG